MSANLRALHRAADALIGQAAASNVLSLTRK